MSKKALLLVGSPRGENSNSNSLGSYLMDRLHEEGLETDRVMITKALESDEATEEMVSKVDGADIVVLASPLYVDQFPSFVIRAMELICERKRPAGMSKEKRLLAIVNCGFPEPEQNCCAVAISRNFARMSGMEWAGCLSIGMGMAINGEPLENRAGMTRNLRKGMSIASDALANGMPLPKEAGLLASRPFIPLFLTKYVLLPLIAGRWFEAIAKKNGVLDRMRDKPYAR
jgi:multimeric flavodoxin WrbA